jgi:histidinol-phosphate aminotransferase
MKVVIADLLRENIKQLIPYSSARDDYKGKANIWLDANENPFENGLNRYPDPYQKQLKSRIAEIKNVVEEQIFIGNGSDEIIDLLIRAFCEPGKDSIATIDPSYGMYEVSANINHVALIKIPLSEDFSIDADLTIEKSSRAKLLFLCSPNNPSANVLDQESINKIVANFKGIVIIDEAYIDFSKSKSAVELLSTHNNLLVMQTLSKAWGLAGLRIGLAFCDRELVAILNKIKPPYNINTLSQHQALKELADVDSFNEKVQSIIRERNVLMPALVELPIVIKVYPSDANFVLVRFTSAKSVYDYLTNKGIVVRDRSKALHCHNCLRITIGTPEENKLLIETLKSYEEGIIY